MSQTLPLVEQLKSLERLQELDLKIDSIKKNQNSLPENLRLLDATLSKIQSSILEKKNQISEIEKTHRQTMAALDMNRDRLSRSNAKLDVVHNSQEFQAANKEIDQLKKLGHTLEEQSKRSTDQLDGPQKELDALTEKFKVLTEERNSKAGLLAGQDQVFKKDLLQLISERSELEAKVERRILTQYDRIRAARNGLGIVPIVDGQCKGCNMLVPPQLANEIHRGNVLHSCPSCHRLLFVCAPAGSPSSSVQEQK